MNIEKKLDAIIRYIVAETDEEREIEISRMRDFIEAADKEERCKDIDDIIFYILSDIGMPNSVKGYKYCAFAIKAVVEHPDIIESITGALYPSVAEEFDTTVSKVERSIRHSIKNSFDHIDAETMKLYFGNIMKPWREQPTNSEFIARMSNIVRNRMNMA